MCLIVCVCVDHLRIQVRQFDNDRNDDNDNLNNIQVGQCQVSYDEARDEDACTRLLPMETVPAPVLQNKGAHTHAHTRAPTP